MPEKMSPIITKNSVFYELEHHYALSNGQRVRVLCEVNKDGQVSIHPVRGEKFWFQNSDAELVDRIADLIKQAAALAQSEEF